MRTLTMGTKLYKIPHIKLEWPLEITEDDGTTTCFCPYFNEYGEGKDFDSAVQDLGRSLVDLYNSMKCRKNLSDEDSIIKDRLKEQLP